MPSVISTDVLIVGAGVAGLWLNARLRRQGFSTVVVESATLGGGQSVKSQGIIHGGAKYALHGALTGASEAIADMPRRWREALAGSGELDLSGVRLLSEAHYLWSPGTLAGNLTSFFASKAVRGRVDQVKGDDLPLALQDRRFKGKVYRLAELVIDVPSLIDRLAQLAGDGLLAGQHIEPLREGDALVGLKVDGREIRAQRIVLSAGAGTQHDALGADLATVDLQAYQCVAFAQRFDVLPGKQTIAGQLRQAINQARHIDDQLRQAIDLALEAAVLQGQGQVVALDLVDTAAHGLAGEKTGEVAGEGAGGPQVMRFGQQAHAGQVQLATARQRFTPAARHIGNGFGSAGERAVQGVFRTAVNNPLGLHALPTPQGGAFHHHRGKPLAAQARIQPEAGNPGADNQNVGGNNGWHGRPQCSRQEAQYTGC